MLRHSHRHGRVGRAGRTGTDQLASSAQPTQSGCLHTTPGAHQPRLPGRPAPSLPPHRRAPLQGKQRPHGPRQRPCGNRGGKGGRGARPPLLLAACRGGGHSAPQADQSEGEAAPPARAEQGRRGRPRPARLRGAPGGGGRYRRQRGGPGPHPRPAASAAASPPRTDTSTRDGGGARKPPGSRPAPAARGASWGGGRRGAEDRPSHPQAGIVLAPKLRPPGEERRGALPLAAGSEPVGRAVEAFSACPHPSRGRCGGPPRPGIVPRGAAHPSPAAARAPPQLRAVRGAAKGTRCAAGAARPSFPSFPPPRARARRRRRVGRGEAVPAAAARQH